MYNEVVISGNNVDLEFIGNKIFYEMFLVEFILKIRNDFYWKGGSATEV